MNHTSFLVTVIVQPPAFMIPYYFFLQKHYDD